MGKEIYNTAEYWDERFSGGSWDAYDGDKQSVFFAQLAMDALPSWMKDQLRKNAWTVTDMGCAQGGGTALLARYFPTCRFTGVDFSSAALDAAREKYPFCEFRLGDMLQWEERCDVLFSSNTLEHVRAPRKIMEKLARCADRHVIFLLPLRDRTDSPEHFSIFDESFFPVKLGDFTLTWFREIDCSTTGTPFWPGAQILLIYSAEGELRPDRTLADLSTNEEYASMKIRWEERRSAAAALEAENGDLRSRSEEVLRQVQELSDQLDTARRDFRRTEKDLSGALAEGNALRQELAKKDQLISEKNTVIAEQNTAIAEKDAVIAAQDTAISEKNTVIADRNSALAEKAAVLREKERLLSDVSAALDTKTTELEATARALEERENSLRNCAAALDRMNSRSASLAEAVRELSSHKIYRLAHFLNRIKWQLIKGGRDERREFWRWLLGHFRGKANEDRRYNPLFRVIERLETLPETVAPALPSKPEKPRVVETGVPAFSCESLSEAYTRPDVLLFSVIDYDFRFQRPQHIADGLAKHGHRVFYFNANFTDGERYLLDKRKENLFLFTLPNKMHSAVYSTDFTDGSTDIRSVLDEIVNKYAVRDALIVCAYPTWHNAVRHLQTKFGFMLATDYMDDYGGFDNVEKSFVERECLALLKQSDLVIASSDYLAGQAARLNENVAVVRNGTEYEHFHKAYREHGAAGRKVIGYYGAIAHWFDFQKIRRLSRDYPQADIVLIGAVTSGEGLLKDLPNVQLLGEKSYAELPEYLAGFDVCLIPFETETELIKATNPVKFYEYLSAGKKIVATCIPELEPFRDRFVYLADDDEQFSRYVGLCLRREDTLADSRAAMEFARENDWSSRIRQFQTLAYQLYPLVSIVVLCYNQLEYTKKCIDSILRYTAWPNYEVVLVDNASSDDTPAWIREISKTQPGIVPVINATNRGFAGGNNDGIRASRGKYIVLLNNDTIVTRGWLTGLVKHCRANDDRCIVGPVTNSIGNEAMIRTNYADEGEMPGEAYAYTTTHMGQVYPHVNVLAMFCVLFPRRLTEEIGFLDENYGIGMFEDDDYSVAAVNAGYRLVLAEDVFVHHFGSASFSKLTDEVHRELFERNKAYFEKKWNTEWIMHRYRPSLTPSEECDTA